MTSHINYNAASMFVAAMVYKRPDGWHWRADILYAGPFVEEWQAHKDLAERKARAERRRREQT